MNFYTKINHLKALFSILLLSLFIGGCLKSNDYPPEPVIQFMSYTYKDSIDDLGNPAHLGRITFSFTDGDGDLGLGQSDTAPPFDYNLYINRIGIKGAVEQAPEELKFRIPYITPKGQIKALTGEIDVNLDIIPLLVGYDTLFYELFLLDRALNKSNTIVTDNIAL